MSSFEIPDWSGEDPDECNETPADDADGQEAPFDPEITFVNDGNAEEESPAMPEPGSLRIASSWGRHEEAKT